ncbi:hypothetical protein U6010_11170 [Pseudomonas aeruginosa]|uniref:hypothetical protein n=1 Tax=Pseudomonas aeruginosa TaxID=287 RepID=UPI002ADD8E72|nr:hypothetical protein [Pseudomonas aeruginosa]MEA0989002.1 hypothetical protein [Pseudomonas aeruginosa]
MTCIMKPDTVYYLRHPSGVLSENYILDGTYFEYGDAAGQVETDGTFRYYLQPQDGEFGFSAGHAGILHGLTIQRAEGPPIHLVEVRV